MSFSYRTDRGDFLTFDKDTGVLTVGPNSWTLPASGTTIPTSTDRPVSAAPLAAPNFTSTLTLSGIQSLSGAGAVDVVTFTTKVTSTGANALTLADGANGQVKAIILTVDGGDATLTPTTKTGYSTIVFNDAGDSVLLQFFTTLGWMVLSNFGATIS